MRTTGYLTPGCRLCGLYTIPYSLSPLVREWQKISGGGNSLSGLVGCRTHPALVREIPSTELSVWQMVKAYKK